MKHYPSLLFRLTSAITLSAMFYVLAIGLWSYQSNKLGISADVTVANQRVSMNFDELSVKSGLILMTEQTKLSNEYQSYGVIFTSDNPVENISYARYEPKASLISTAWLNPNPGSAYQSKLNISSAPNAVTGSAPYYWTVENGVTKYYPAMSTKAPIILQFIDPYKAPNPSTTDYVKFNLSIDQRDGDPICKPIIGNCSFPVKVTAYNASGNILGTQSFTATGTYPVELKFSDIAKIRIEGSSRWYTSIFGPDFILDDLSFNLPKTSAKVAATLQMSKSTYQLGETVTGTFTNTGETPITCPAPESYLLIKNSAGQGVRNYTGILQQVLPGQSLKPTWDQKDLNGQQVPAGSYSFTVSCQGISQTASLTIAGPPTPKTDAVFSTDKSNYNVGENVTFNFKNTGQADFTCPANNDGSVLVYAILDSSARVVYNLPDSQKTKTLKTNEVITWSWDQKSNTGSQVNPGTYTATVTCGNLTRSTSFVIQSTTPGSLDFTVNPTSGPAPLLVTATYTGSETCLIWDFGDGTVIMNGPATQTHRYTSSGTFTITLRSCAGASGSKQVTVLPASPSPSPSPSPTGSGPKIDKLPKLSTTKLVGTGGNLGFNLLVATLLSGLVTYLFLRRPNLREKNQ